MHRQKKPQNTGAVLAFCSGMFFVLAAVYCAYYWAYYATIRKDPVTVQGKVIDLGGSGSGMTYEYAFQGRRFEGAEPRRSGFGKWVGASLDVVISKSSPERSTLNLESLRSRAATCAWAAAWLLLATAVAGFFGLRYRARMPIEADDRQSPRNQAATATVFLAGLTFIITTASIGLAQFSGEQKWLQQTASVINQPNLSAEEKVLLLERSVVRRNERVGNMTPVLLYMMGGSFVLLIAAAAYLGMRRRRAS